MANESFGLTKIQQIAIGGDDLEKSTAFYRDQLGMQFLAWFKKGVKRVTI